MDQITEITGAITIQTLEQNRENLKLNSGLDRKPVKVHKYRSDVAEFRNSNNETSSVVLYKLKAVSKRLAATVEKRVTVINAGGNKSMNKGLTGFR